MFAPRLLAGTSSAFAASATAAHGALAPVASSAAWTFDAWVATPLALVAISYGIGFVRVLRRGTARAPRRLVDTACFYAAWLALVGALVSPLHELGERLFTFHMIEHEIVMAVAAPLLVLARPAGILLWSLPPPARRGFAALALRPSVAGPWAWATVPRNATVLHGLAIWLWHVPSLFDTAVLDITLHRLQHLSFLLTALVFWWSVWRRSPPGVAIWHLFVTMVHTSLLGAWIALAPRVLYHIQTAGALAFGMSPLEDQQLAGVLMWVPAETVYVGAALMLAVRWLDHSSRAAGDGVVRSSSPGGAGA